MFVSSNEVKLLGVSLLRVRLYSNDRSRTYPSRAGLSSGDTCGGSDDVAAHVPLFRQQRTLVLPRFHLVLRQVLGMNVLCRYKPVVSLFANTNLSARLLLELEESDQVVRHELCGDRAAHERRELAGADGKILLNLYDVQGIRTTLRLHRCYVVNSAPVQADVNLVRFHLSHPLSPWSAGGSAADSR